MYGKPFQKSPVKRQTPSLDLPGFAFVIKRISRQKLKIFIVEPDDGGACRYGFNGTS